MKSLQRKFDVLVVAAAMAAGVAGNAQAGVLTQSVLEITGFKFLNPNGTTIDITQLPTLTFTDSSQMTAFLNGTTATQTVNSSAFGTLDLPQQCVDTTGGTTCTAFGQNNYTHRFPPSTFNVARGDTLLQGTPINVPGFPPNVGADAHAVAEAQLTSVLGNGNVGGNLALVATFQFRPNSNQTVTISMASNSHLIAALGFDKGSANATEGWVINVFDNTTGAQVFSWAPDGTVGTG